MATPTTGVVITPNELNSLAQLGQALVSFVLERGLSRRQRLMLRDNPKAFTVQMLGEMALAGRLTPAAC